jgi:hypothetical protein
MQSDEHERRSRLVTLVYEVLRDMESPADDVTDMALFSHLSRAFFDKATALSTVGAVGPRARETPPTILGYGATKPRIPGYRTARNLHP